ALVAGGRADRQGAGAAALAVPLHGPRLSAGGAQPQPSPATSAGQCRIPGAPVAGRLEAEEQRAQRVEQGRLARLVGAEQDGQALAELPGRVVEAAEAVDLEPLDAHQRSSAATRSSTPSASASSSSSP